MENQLAKQYNILELVHKRSPDFRFAYTNSSALAANFYDANLLFGEIQRTLTDEAPYIEDRVAVTMTWEHLKALDRAIQKAIAEYEKHGGGPIRDNPETTHPAE
jgi:hypothetical protein